MPAARAVPGWVITHDYEDEELGALKAGKEAGCFLVRARHARSMPSQVLNARWHLACQQSKSYQLTREAWRPHNDSVKSDVSCAKCRVLINRRRRAFDS